MSNIQAPQGFMSVGNDSGGAPTFGNAVGYIQASYSTPLFIGDVVVFSSGYLNAASPGTTTIAGIFVGCHYSSPGAGRPIFGYWPGSGAVSGSLVKAYFINDPFAEFYVQSNGSAITQANVDQNINFATGSGNTLNGRSAQSVDQSTIATTSTLPFRIVSVGPFTGSDGASSYNWVKVAFNNQMFRNLTAV